MDIGRIFNSKTRKELFRLYFTNPDSEYYLRELERLLRVPVSMIRAELIRLEDDGVFVSKRKANLVYYYLNKSYPLFEELKSIVFKTIGAQALLKQMVKEVKGVELAFIYGSFARKEENAKSDIDILIVGEINESALLSKIRKLERILKREINYALFTKNEFREKIEEKDSFILGLKNSPKIFLVGSKNDL